jgi:choice-of-anchor B domain-containing protein
MKSVLTGVFILLCTMVSLPQNENVVLLGSLNPYPAQKYSSLWGYTAPDGREYALLSVQHGTSIIDITDPSSPVERAFIPGLEKAPYHWREMKTHSEYAYIVSEGLGTPAGLQIVDLSALPDTAVLVTTNSEYFTTAHNIFIDDGYAYVVGTGNGGGIHILDLADPINPERKSYYINSGYVHDLYVWDDTVYASCRSTYDLIDVSDKTNPALVSKSAALPGIYAHSGWLTEDKRYFLATEEFNVRDLTVWDLQDRSSWNLVVPEWQMPSNTPIHNIFVKGIYAHIAYYKEGYVVLDVSDPLNPKKVGQYDTYPGTTGNYAGAWNCYPYFNSGAVIVSDMSTGLYIFDFTLDGNVPVELAAFTAEASGDNVHLNWKTITETNNLGFEVQKSFDDKSWMTFGFVKGFGTTSEPKKYSLTDKNPGSWKVSYRLVQNDFDGTKKHYSPIEVFLGILIDFSLEQNYPNPFNPSTKIKYNVSEAGFTSLKIYNMVGEEISVLVSEEKEIGTHEVNFNGSGLSSGIYVARLKSGTQVSNIKMTLLK